MITIHHLGVSQSERIVWLFEELELPYNLVRYERTPLGAAPPEYKALHPQGTAPVIVDDGLLLAESGAILEYVIQKYGNGRLVPKPHDANFASYLYWMHFANGTLVPSEMINLILDRLDVSGDHPLIKWTKGRSETLFEMIDSHLAKTPYFAGESFTAADIMMFFPLTTMRKFTSRHLSPFKHTLAYLALIGQRPAYVQAIGKCDPHMGPMLS